MADAPSYAASVEHIDLRDLRSRHVPDVPEDVDFLLEHLNDPNFDLTQSRPPSFVSTERRTKKDLYESYDIDTESQADSDRYVASRAESQVTAFDDFDE
jgi:hypothetical protein